MFTRYGEPSGATNVSAALNKVIRQSLKIADRSLVAYSTRHTFADRCRAAGIDEVYQQVLMGHRSRFSTSVADNEALPPGRRHGCGEFVALFDFLFQQFQQFSSQAGRLHHAEFHPCPLTSGRSAIAVAILKSVPVVSLSLLLIIQMLGISHAFCCGACFVV